MKILDMKKPSDLSKTDDRENDPAFNEKIDRLDLEDSPRDIDRLKREETTIDLPEVSDIPGQEHIHVMPLGELADTTISSDDEEGAGILDDLNDEDNPGISVNTDAQRKISDERIPRSGYNDLRTTDNQLKRTSLDSTDFENTPLNQSSQERDRTGADLDVPGSDGDDANENIGEEDEENNSYSLGSDRNDQ